MAITEKFVKEVYSGLTAPDFMVYHLPALLKPSDDLSKATIEFLVLASDVSVDPYELSRQGVACAFESSLTSIFAYADSDHGAKDRDRAYALNALVDTIKSAAQETGYTLPPSRHDLTAHVRRLTERLVAK